MAQTSDDAGIRACEASVIGTLRSPASYALFKAEQTSTGVEIIYDAANGFGALLRGKASCSFVSSPDGLRLISEPAISVTMAGDDCTAQVRGWIAKGNITERAAKAFFDDCAAQLDAAQRHFIQAFEDLDVAYPIPPSQTSVPVLPR